MHRYRQALWAANQQTSKQRKAQLEQFKSRVDRIIRSSKTVHKSISDFPEIEQYLSGRFPDVDLTDINIYIAPPRVIQQAGLPQIGGFFFKETHDIFVKDDISSSKKKKTRFDKLMDELCPMEIAVEDVVVHELVHAVSHKIGRSSSRYTHMEEEFVYGNCVDFYKQKGMTDDDIVNNHLLPFCMNDIYASVKDMSEVFAASGLAFREVKFLDEAGFQAYCNKNADKLIPSIRVKALEKGFSMLDLYQKYGRDMELTGDTPPVDDPASVRFSSLELDDADL